MTFVDGVVRVRVPATSANLGPGFDSLGVALNLYDDLEAEVIGSGIQISVAGEGAGSVPLDEDHLVYQAMSAAFDLMGVVPPGIRLHCVNQVPHGRGLGSSAAAIVGGIIAARALVSFGDELLDDLAVLQLATDLEGHPDNVAPALFGGFTISWIAGAAASALRLDVAKDVTVFVPEKPVSTTLARDILPTTVSHDDAAANAARAALLVAALLQSPEHLIFGTEDRLHQTYRAEAMPDTYRFVRQLRVDGVPAVISGAGPTVLAFARGIADRAPEGWTVHELSIDPDGARVC